MIQLSSNIFGLTIHKETSDRNIEIDDRGNQNFLVRPLWYYSNTKMLIFRCQKEAIKYGLYLFKIQQLTKPLF